MLPTVIYNCGYLLGPFGNLKAASWLPYVADGLEFEFSPPGPFIAFGGRCKKSKSEILSGRNGWSNESAYHLERLKGISFVHYQTYE